MANDGHIVDTAKWVVSKEDGTEQPFNEYAAGLKPGTEVRIEHPDGPPEPELVKGVRERLDALTGMGGGPWANVWSSIDYAGSLRDRLEVDLAHHTPATPAERLALLERIDALSVAMGRAWQVADMLGWESPSAAKAG